MERKTYHPDHRSAPAHKTTAADKPKPATEPTEAEKASTGTPTNPEGLPINRSVDPPTMPSPAPPGGVPAANDPAKPVPLSTEENK